MVLLLLQSSTPSDPETLHAVRLKVRDAMITAGVREQAIEQMEVAVGEILSNVHLHAYRDTGSVSVAVFHFRVALSVIITDWGTAIVAPDVPELPAWTTQGGRGLYLASHLVDDLVIRVNRVGHGLRVRLTKRLEEAEASGDGLQAA